MELRFWSLQRKSYLCHLYLATLDLEDRSRRGTADTSPRHRLLLLSGAMYHNSQFLVICDRQPWSLLPSVWGRHTDVSSRRDAGAHWVHVWVHWRWRGHGCAPTNPPKTKTLRFTTSQPRHGGSQPRCIHVNHVVPVHNLAVFISVNTRVSSCSCFAVLHHLRGQSMSRSTLCAIFSLMARMPASTSAHQAVKLQPHG